MFGIGHRLPTDLTSDDIFGPGPVYDLAATDASFEESRQIREAAMKAHAEVSIRNRIEDSVRARPRTQTVLRDDDVIMVWKTNPPSKRGRWVGPGVCQHARIAVEVQPASVQTGYYKRVPRFGDPEPLLDDMKAEFQEFPGRREGIPPPDADKQPAAPRVIQEEEDRTSALIPTLPQVISPPPSLPELDSESHPSLREALQGENVQVPSDVSSHPDSDRSRQTVSQNFRNQLVHAARCLVT